MPAVELSSGTILGRGKLLTRSERRERDNRWGGCTPPGGTTVRRDCRTSRDILAWNNTSRGLFSKSEASKPSTLDVRTP